MTNFLLKIVTLFFFLLTSVNSEVIKKFDISGNKRISNETIIIFDTIRPEYFKNMTYEVQYQEEDGRHH